MLSRTPARLIDLCDSMKLSTSDCLLTGSDLEIPQLARLIMSNSEDNMVATVLVKIRGQASNKSKAAPDRSRDSADIVNWSTRGTLGSRYDLQRKLLIASDEGSAECAEAASSEKKPEAGAVEQSRGRKAGMFLRWQLQEYRMQRNSEIGRCWCRARSDSLHESSKVWRCGELWGDLTMQAVIE